MSKDKIESFASRPKKSVEPKIAFGNKGVARMSSKRCDEIASRSAAKIVRTVVARSCAAASTSDRSTLAQLVESLVWPFVARRSLSKEWFTTKNFRRFIESFKVTAKNIAFFVNDQNHEQSFIKYYHDLYLCQVFRDAQRPPKDAWITKPLYVGFLKRFVARAIAKRDVSFIYSLQKGSKKSWPKMSDVKKDQALQKHAQRFSSNHGNIPRDLFNRIRQNSKNIFKKVREHQASKFMPSGSACLQASRRNGGALSLYQPFQFPNKSEPESQIVGRLPYLQAALTKWRNNSHGYAVWRVLEGLSFRSEKGLEFLDLDIVAIPEPGKFRIISKGDGFLYSAIQPLQGLMIDAWKMYKASTMTDSDLTERVRKIDRNIDFGLWCSVDYEAATDLVKKDCTRTAFSGCEGLPFFDLGMLSLHFNKVRYPDGTELDQKDGQPMGHPLSFPLLCIINLSVYHTALRRWVLEADGTEREMKLLWDNVLVNGDDMLFKCRESFYPVFLKTAADAGFKISEGKNYLSRDCCMINSQVFRRTSGRMERCGYLNQKLLTGHGVKTGDSLATPIEIAPELNKMCRLVPWTRCCIPRTFQRWSKDWFGPIYKPNWYLPVHLGGFGLDIAFAPSNWTTTNSQRRIAQKFIENPKLALYRKANIPIPKDDYINSLANWRMISYDENTPNVDSNLVEVSDSWLAKLAYASRAHDGAKDPDKDSVIIQRFLSKKRKTKGIMSHSDLFVMWNVKFLAFNLPPCPPFSGFRNVVFPGGSMNPLLGLEVVEH
jgi:hypothetical protein